MDGELLYLYDFNEKEFQVEKYLQRLIMALACPAPNIPSGHSSHSYTSNHP